MRLLVTGFGPFLDHEDNPSLALACAMDGRRARGVRLSMHGPLPVVYGVAGERALRAARAIAADGVLALGLAAKSERVRVEAWARNACTSSKPDGAGAFGEGRPVVPGAPARRLATLDPEPVHRALRAAGFATDRSDDAGGYVCNDVYYRLLHGGVPALFVHVPPHVDVERLAQPLALGAAASLVAARGRRGRSNA